MYWQQKNFAQLSNRELYQILQLRSEIFVIEQQCIYQDMDDHDFVAVHLFILSESDGQIIAYCRLLPKGTKTTEAAIGRVIVRSAYRGKHLARLIIQKAVDIIIKDWHEDKVYIQAQVHLEKFYRSLGFIISSDQYLEDGILHFDMIRHR